MSSEQIVQSCGTDISTKVQSGLRRVKERMSHYDGGSKRAWAQNFARKYTRFLRFIRDELGGGITKEKIGKVPGKNGDPHYGLDVMLRMDDRAGLFMVSGDVTGFAVPTEQIVDIQLDADDNLIANLCEYKTRQQYHWARELFEGPGEEEFGPQTLDGERMALQMANLNDPNHMMVGFIMRVPFLLAEYGVGVGAKASAYDEVLNTALKNIPRTDGE